MGKTFHKSMQWGLLVIPAAFLLLQLLLKADYRYFFLSSHDPAYGYLFNGLNLAMGNLQLGLYAHPGAPLHLLVALNLAADGLIQGFHTLPERMLSNPELFLHIISIELLLMQVAGLYLTGLYVFRNTGNKAVSLSVQLTPFLSVQGFAFSSVVMLEPLLLFPVLVVVAVLSAYAFNPAYVISRKACTALAVAMAFGLSAKVVFFPVFLLPFVVLDGWRNKVIYTATVLLALTIFLIPVYAVFPQFLHWIRDLFMHTGQYGSGSAGVIDWHSFGDHFRRLLRANGWFTVCLVLVLIMVIMAVFRGKIHDRKVRVAGGVLVVFILNMVMVAKHYAVHYMIISHNLVVIGFLVSATWIYTTFRPGRNLPESRLLLLTVTICMVAVGWIISAISYSPRLRNPRMETLPWGHTTLPRMLVLEAPGPFRETALFHGMSFSGGMKGTYAQILRKQYPETFFYYPAEDRLADWSHDVNKVSLLARFPEILIMYTSRRDTLPENLAISLQALTRQGFVKSVCRVAADPATSQYLYRIECDTARTAAAITMHPEAIPETGTLPLNPDNPYGGNVKFRLKKGYYELRVWRKASDNKGALVVSDTEGRGFYKAVESPFTSASGWDQLTLVVEVPPDMEGREVLVYVWYPGKKECTFKDLHIKRFEVN